MLDKLVAGRALDVFLVLRHRVVGHDLALEHPHLDADDAVGGERLRYTVVYVSTQRVKGYAAFGVPFHAGDFVTAETAGAVDSDAECAKAEGRLHGALHGAAESDTALKLLGNAFSDEGRIDFGFADFDDVQMDFILRELAEVFLD